MRVIEEIIYYKKILSKQQFKTLYGQAKSGDCLGAEKGLRKVLKKNNITKNRGF